VIYIDGKQPDKKGQTKVIEYEHHRVTYKGVSLTSEQVTAHWRLDSITDLEGNSLRELVTESKRSKENKGSWHIKTQEEIKNRFPEAQLERFVYLDSDKNYRIADVYIPEKNIVIEAQHSPMSKEEFEDRNDDFIIAGKRPGWIISPARGSKNTGMGENALSSYFGLVKGDFVTVLDANRIQTFFYSTYLEEQNIPVFLDVGWNDHFLQFCFSQPNNNSTYQYSLLFKVVNKKDILSIINEENIYENIRAEIEDLCPITEEVKDKIIEIESMTESFDKLKKQIEAVTQIKRSMKNATNEEQIKRAIKYYAVQYALDITSADQLEGRYTKLKKECKKATELLRGLSNIQIRDVPWQFHIFFKEAELEETKEFLMKYTNALRTIINFHIEEEEKYYFKPKPKEFPSPFKLLNTTFLPDFSKQVKNSS
jgi:hypothetical protein